MWIETLELRQVRNYRHAVLTFSSHLNVLLGHNAAGKSNLLEAIYFLTRGRSFRTAQDRDLIQWQEEQAFLKLVARPSQVDGEQAMATSIEAKLSLSAQHQLKTHFKLCEKAIRFRSDVVGQVPVVSFFLSDLKMLRGSPEDRRSALDGLVAQRYPGFLSMLSRYQKIKEQKSQFLRQSIAFPEPYVMASYNDQLVECASWVMAYRCEGLAVLEPYVQTYWETLTPETSSSIKLLYQSSIEKMGMTLNLPKPPFDIAALQSFFLAQLTQSLEQVYEQEIRRHQVLVGPHRDDIGFWLNGHDACQFASQGQQRSIVLAIKLAEIQLLKHHLNGEIPILLLDDVMAELDPLRQHQLLAYLDPQMQVILSTTHLDADLNRWVQTLTDSHIIQVTHGEIEEGKSQLVGEVLE